MKLQTLTMAWYSTSTIRPPTYNRGKSRLDYIMASTDLLPAVLSCTILPIHHELSLADHRAIVADFSTQLLFGTTTQASIPTLPATRGLRLNNAQVLEKYTSLLIKLVTDHKLLEKAEQLAQQFRLQGATIENIDTINNLDGEFGRYIHSAERQASKINNRHLPWSPILHATIQKLKYWKIRLSSTLNHTWEQAAPTLHQWRTDNKIDDDFTQDIPTIRLRLSEAWKIYKQVKKDAPTLREEHLRREAEMREARGDGRAEAILKTLITKEKQKAMWQRIKKAHHPPKDRLMSLLVFSQTVPGQYNLVQTKKEIHSHLLNRNYHHLRAPATSPLMQSTNFPPTNPPAPTSIPSETPSLPYSLTDDRLQYQHPLLHKLLTTSSDFDPHQLDDAEITFIRAIHEARDNPPMNSAISEQDFKTMDSN